MEKDISVHTTPETDRPSGEPLEISNICDTEFDQLAFVK